MIEAIVYRAGIVRRSWRFKLVDVHSGKKLGHHYNRKADAERAVRAALDPNVPVRLMVQNEHTGILDDKGFIR